MSILSLSLSYSYTPESNRASAPLHNSPVPLSLVNSMTTDITQHLRKNMVPGAPLLHLPLPYISLLLLQPVNYEA